MNSDDPLESALAAAQLTVSNIKYAIEKNMGGDYTQHLYRRHVAFRGQLIELLGVWQQKILDADCDADYAIRESTWLEAIHDLQHILDEDAS